MICSISGELAQDPVVSVKSGNIYEKRLIEKYIDANGREPTTGQPLALTDLVTIVKVGNSNSSNNNGAGVKPRVGTTSSIPGMLQMFQNEWDALMLETFTLRQQFESVRQELAHSLYQYDAACRVIARLIKERDAAKAALANTPIRTTNINNNNNNQNDKMEVENTQKLPEDILSKVGDLSKTLSAQRKKRSKPDNLPTTDEIKSYSMLASNQPQQTSGGLSCIDQNGVLIAVGSGGDDGEITLYDIDNSSVKSALKGHSKRVESVSFTPSGRSLISGSRDRSVRLWNVDSGEGQVSKYTGEVLSVHVHPSGDIAAVGGSDRSWAIFDIRKGSLNQVLKNINAANGPCGTVRFHPDGVFLGVGSDDGQISLWDICQNNRAITLDAHTQAVRSITFSENGYFMASCDNTCVKIWDLRKSICLQTFAIDGEHGQSVSFDHSGSYIVVAGSSLKVIHLSGKASFELTKQLDGQGGLYNGARWSLDSQTLTTVSEDGLIKLWGSQ